MSEPMADDLEDDVDEESENYAPPAFFVGPCTCPHGEDAHTWGHCGVRGCRCEAGWEE